MPRRLAPLTAARALVGVLLGAAATSGCYELPAPDCGFVCGPDEACPDGYTCADDHRCHRVGAPATLSCPTPDARLPLDAAPDARADAAP